FFFFFFFSVAVKSQSLFGVFADMEVPCLVLVGIRKEPTICRWHFSTEDYLRGESGYKKSLRT
ncbi:hypothetical protein, partial [Salmonella enterica]|uniref:hypothetical protein n=1 Tax=Salmonella enterica TaxID=28901 RepID=UPI001C38EDCD